VQKTTKFLLYVFAFLYLLNQWGLDVRPYLASLGIAGIAIGFAIQDFLKNIFGGISLIMDGNIRVGDKIRLEGGQVGIVEEIGLRSTKMRTFDNELEIIPNGIMANTRLHNYALPSPVNRVVIPFTAAYGEDVKKIQTEVLKVLHLIHLAIKENPAVDFVRLGDTTLEFEAIIWVKDYNEATIAKYEANEKIYALLKKLDVQRPTQVVSIKK
jgi:MscS family membrane protein